MMMRMLAAAHLKVEIDYESHNFMEAVMQIGLGKGGCDVGRSREKRRRRRRNEKRCDIKIGNQVCAAAVGAVALICLRLVDTIFFVVIVGRRWCFYETNENVYNNTV